MGRLQPCLHKVNTLEEVVNCYRITGNENIVMEVVLKDQKHLEQLIDTLIPYGETKTQIILSNVKHNSSVVQLQNKFK
jgi:Lrp/AsnC family leucine-responsive transcriptional regulator